MPSTAVRFSVTTNRDGRTTALLFNSSIMKHENIMKVVDIHYNEFSKAFIGFIAKQLPVYEDRVLGEDLFDPEHIRECTADIPESIESELTVITRLMKAHGCGYFRIVFN